MIFLDTLFEQNFLNKLTWLSHHTSVAEQAKEIVSKRLYYAISSILFIP